MAVIINISMTFAAFIQFCLPSPYFHSCKLSSSIGIKCWGHNDLGELGYGDSEPRGDQPNEMGRNLSNIDFGDVNVKYALKVLSDTKRCLHKICSAFSPYKLRTSVAWNSFPVVQYLFNIIIMFSVHRLFRARIKSGDSP